MVSAAVFMVCVVMVWVGALLAAASLLLA